MFLARLLLKDSHLDGCALNNPPCATSAVLPLQELTTQQMVSKAVLYSELNGVPKAWARQRLYSQGPSLKTPLAF